MRALHEETVARATPVEFTSKLPPKVNRLFEGLCLGTAEGVHQTCPTGTYIKVQNNYSGNRWTVIPIFDKNWLKKRGKLGGKRNHADPVLSGHFFLLFST